MLETPTGIIQQSTTSVAGLEGQVIKLRDQAKTDANQPLGAQAPVLSSSEQSAAVLVSPIASAVDEAPFQAGAPAGVNVDTQAIPASLPEGAGISGLVQAEELTADDGNKAEPSEDGMVLSTERAAPKEALALDAKEWKLPKRLAKDRNFLKIQLRLRSKVIQEGGVIDETKIIQDVMREYYGERVESFLERNGNEIPDEILNDKIYGKHYREIVEELVGKGKPVNKENMEQIKKEALMRFLHEKDLKGMSLLLKMLFAIIATSVITGELGKKIASPQGLSA